MIIALALVQCLYLSIKSQVSLQAKIDNNVSLMIIFKAFRLTTDYSNSDFD